MLITEEETKNTIKEDCREIVKILVAICKTTSPRVFN